MYGYLYNDEQLIRSLDNTIQLDDNYAQIIILPQQNLDAPDHTPYQLWQVSYDEVDLIVLWPIPPGPPQLFSKPASVTSMSRKQRYLIPKAAMMEPYGIESIQYAKGVPLSWDTDTDNQIPTPDYYKDHLSDEIVELIQYGKGVITAHDHDADYQKLWAEYYKDHVSDEGIEILLVSQAWDTDSENQIRQPDWNLDYEEEKEGIPFILVPNVFDLDIDNQLQQLSWINDYNDFDVEIPIIPIIVVVPILYKLTANPKVNLVFTSNAEMELYTLDVAQSVHISSVTSVLSMSLYKLTAQNRIVMSSFTNHGPV